MTSKTELLLRMSDLDHYFTGRDNLSIGKWNFDSTDAYLIRTSDRGWKTGPAQRHRLFLAWESPSSRVSLDFSSRMWHIDDVEGTSKSCWKETAIEGSVISMRAYLLCKLKYFFNFECSRSVWTLEQARREGRLFLLSKRSKPKINYSVHYYVDIYATKPVCFGTVTWTRTL